MRNAVHIQLVFLVGVIALAVAPPVLASPKSTSRIAHREPTLGRTTFEKLIDYIETEMRWEGVVGMSVAIVEDQEIIFSRGFGYQDRERIIPASGNTVYRMGSISKVLTATAIMQLVEQGKINLDAPVTRYIPEFRVKSRFKETNPITVRHLLTHHSGLPTDLMKGADTRHPQSLADFSRALAKEHLAQQPGTVFQYSNLGYAVLGYLIETVTGEDFDEYMARNVLNPLHMDNSGFTPTPQVTFQLAKGYLQGAPCEQYPVRELSAGALYASVNDMASFMKSVFRKGAPLLDAGSVEAMLTRQNGDVPADLDISMGLGWQLTSRMNADRNAGTMGWHDGWIWHFSSSMAILPEHKLGIVVATNSDTGKKLVRRIAMRALRRVLWEKHGVDRAAWKPPVNPTLLEKGDLKQFEGIYDTASGVVHLKAVNGRLVGMLRGKPVTLEPMEDGTFVMKKFINEFLSYQSPDLDGLFFRFVEVNGATILATMDGDQRIPFAHRIERSPIPNAWRGTAGTYLNHNTNDDFVYVKSVRIGTEDGFLRAAITVGGNYTPDMKFSVALEADRNNRAFIKGVGRYRGDVLEVVQTPKGRRLRFQGYILTPN